MTTALTDRLELLPITSLPILTEPADLAELIARGLRSEGHEPADGDVLVVAQKFVSKAEGAFVDLNSVVPSEEAREVARTTGKDPRLVHVILQESKTVVRISNQHLITEHRLGYVCANAGVDMSNSGAKDRAVLLPTDPDASAARVRRGLADRFGVNVSVIVSDTHGRPFRNGAIGIAIGVSGLEPLLSYKGEADLDGRILQTSQEAIADELASAASLLMGQGAEAVPVVLVRGYRRSPGEGTHRDLVRDPGSDLFR